MLSRDEFERLIAEKLKEIQDIAKRFPDYDSESPLCITVFNDYIGAFQLDENSNYTMKISKMKIGDEYRDLSY